MSRLTKTLAVAVAAAFAVTACGRAASISAATPGKVYASAPAVSDVGNLLGDSQSWWPAAPTFGVRPLDISNTPTQERFALTLRYTHVGTAERLKITYDVWDSSTLATAIVTNIQSSLGTTPSGPSAGDQVIYYNQMLGFAAAPYVSAAMVRVGQTVVTIEWDRVDGYASTAQTGRIASTIATRLKQSLSGKLQASPQPLLDASLFPAAGPDLTMLGSTELPVDVLAAMLGVASPSDLVGLFSQFGIADVAYGDYTLDSDTHMEVQTVAMTFATPTEATNWISTLVGSSSLDQNGVFSTFDNTTEQYEFAFAAGSHGVIIVCKSVADFEAASRSCEAPVGRVVTAWKADLTAAG